MPVNHELKTLDVFFDAVKRGAKNFEVRKDDRAFQAGDTVTLYRVTQAEIDNPMPGAPPMPSPVMPRNTVNAPIAATISFVLRGGQFGIDSDYVVLALSDIRDAR